MLLVITQNGQSRDYFPDPAKQTLTIGRTHGNDIILMDEKAASRKHATIELTPQGWKVVDQMSSNGTLVNGEKQNFSFIADGDVIAIGKTQIKVVLAPVPGAQVATVGLYPKPDLGSDQATNQAAALSPAIMSEGERRPAFQPKKNNPAVAMAIAAVAVIAIGAIGYAALSSNPAPPEPDKTASNTREVRSVELSESDNLLIADAKSVANGEDSTIDKINQLTEMASSVKGLRGDIASSRILVLKTGQFSKLDAEIRDRVDTNLKTSENAIKSGNFNVAVQVLLDLELWKKSDPIIESRLAGRTKGLAQALNEARTSNTDYINANSYHADMLKNQSRFKEAAGTLSGMIENAWLTDAELASYKNSITELLRRKGVIEAPVIERPDDAPSILDKFKKKKDEGRLPGKNSLLPNGKRSEAILMAELQGKLIDCAKSRTLTSMRFNWKGQIAQIYGATDDKLKMHVSKVDKKTEEEVIYSTAAQWSNISPTAMLELYDRIPEMEAKDLFAVTLYCYENSFMDEASRRAFITYKARNEWKDSIDNLIAKKRHINIPENGFVEHGGMFVTPDEKVNAVFMDNLRGVLERFQKGIGHREKRKRAASEVAFNELLEMGERAVEPSIVILRGVLDKEMENAKKATGLLAGDTSKLNALMAELDKRRDYAMDLIMDKVKYPYPYGANKDEVQAEVDERVAAVREIWNNPASFTGQSNQQLESVMNKIKAIAERMAQIDPAQQYYKETPEETVEYIKNIANEELSIKNYSGNDLGKQKVYNYNVKVLEHNKNLPTGDGHCDSDGRAQVAVTNEYRIMFGLHALKISDKLFWAAWHHSKYCIEHNGGQIAHKIQGEPKGVTPADRMKHEGYPSRGGENIHMNSGGPTAKSSHVSWCHSSGHHRNILTPRWRVLGSGHFKTIWTQNFGAQDEGDGNQVSRGGN